MNKQNKMSIVERLHRFDDGMAKWIKNNIGKWYFILIIIGIGIALLQTFLTGSFKNFKIIVLIYPLLLVIIEFFTVHD